MLFSVGLFVELLKNGIEHLDLVLNYISMELFLFCELKMDSIDLTNHMHLFNIWFFRKYRRICWHFTVIFASRIEIDFLKMNFFFVRIFPLLIRYAKKTVNYIICTFNIFDFDWMFDRIFMWKSISPTFPARFNHKNKQTCQYWDIIGKTL